MSKNNNLPNGRKSLDRLISDLSQFDRVSFPEWTGDDEMLSLIVNDALNGIDVATRYPAFYQELLTQPALRQAFLDTLEIMEKELDGTLVDLPEETEPNLDFLSRFSNTGKIEASSHHAWKVSWQRTIEQLQALFAPPELAYRADPSLFEDPWFALLRDDFTVETVQYAVVLECALDKDDVHALSTFLDVAVTFQELEHQKPFPLKATLRWGSYHESLIVADERRVRFPEIPLKAILDAELEQVQADLDFTLETVS